MTDLGDRLRALAAEAGPPPSGLMDGIRRRHRRHRIRVTIASVAGVALFVFAAPLTTHEILHLAQQPSGPLARSAAGPGSISSSHSGAAPGTILRDCASQNYSDLGSSRWRSQSVQAGPLWFVFARNELTSIVAVRAGAKVIVRVAAAARSRFSFLPDSNSSSRQGKAGITFAACSASYMGPITIWWVSYLNHGLRCVPLQVLAPGARRPQNVLLPTTRFACAH